MGMLRRLWHLLRARQHDVDLQEELAAHRTMLQEQFEADGASARDAATSAQRTMGNDLAARERARDVWVMPWLQDIGSDIRFAARLLLKERVFSIAAVVVLALGIGANTTVFTLVYGINWRGLPVAEPERVVVVYPFDQSGRRQSTSYPEFQDWLAATQTFEGLAALSTAMVNLGDEGRAPDRVMVTHASWNAFRLLGDRPVLGRDFVREDDAVGADPVMLIGYHVWRDRYASAPDVIGRTITVDGRPVVIIGVMAEGMQFPAMSDAWMPIGQTPAAAAMQRATRNLRIFGRVAAGAGMAEATAEVNGIAARLAVDYPDTNKDVRVALEPFTGRANEPFLYAMFAAVGFVLCIACANVASLLLARAAHRSQEIALRGALGASRWRVVRQLLVESLMMAVLAAGLGMLLGRVGMWLFVGDTDPRGIAYWVDWSMDGRVFTFLAIAATATFLLFGVTPALVLSRGMRGEALKEAGRGNARSSRRSTNALLVVELALTVVLLTGATLMTRSLLAMDVRDRVIDSSQLVTASVTPPTRKYPTPEQRLAFLRQLEERLRGMPMVSAATLASNLPFVSGSSRRLTIEGRDDGAPQPPTVLSVTVGDGYFETLGLPIVAGRTFTALDGTEGHDSVIVNRAFAARFFVNQDPIGQRIRLANPNAKDVAAVMTIVGVSPTVRQQPQSQTIDAVAYVPFRSAMRGEAPVSMSLIVRTTATPDAVVGTLREELRQLDPDLALSKIEALDVAVRSARWTHRLFSRVFTVFAGIALLLSAVGLYAVIAYAVGQRTQEIGVRMALGAQRGDVAWLFARRACVQLAVGLAVGLAGALGLGTLLGGLLVETRPTDPITLVIVVGALIAASVVATMVPVRRALRLDPVAALRHE